MRNKLNRVLFLAILASVLYLSGQCLAKGQSPEIFLSKDMDGVNITEEFYCHDKIYIHAIFSNPDKRTYEASVEWINPKAKRQDYASHRFSDSNYRVWFWLKLHPAFGGKFLKSIDPSAGMGEFIGRWRVKLYLDGKLVTTEDLFVAC